MSESYLGKDYRSLNIFPNSYEILWVHEVHWSIDLLVCPTDLQIHRSYRSQITTLHVTRLPLVLCLLLGNSHKSSIRSHRSLTSSSSYDTSFIRSVTNTLFLFSFILFSFFSFKHPIKRHKF